MLSEAVKESGILAVAATHIEAHTGAMSLWQICATFCALVLVCTTFVSHTVGAMVILPVVASVGTHLSQPHPQLLVMATALMCSCAMGLPVSGTSAALSRCYALRACRTALRFRPDAVAAQRVGQAHLRAALVHTDGQRRAGFPNMTGIALEDATGKPYVLLTDFLKVGLPASVMSWVVVVTLGYCIMVMIGY